jgi:hypothetical protein
LPHLPEQIDAVPIGQPQVEQVDERPMFASSSTTTTCRLRLMTAA